MRFYQRTLATKEKLNNLNNLKSNNTNSCNNDNNNILMMIMISVMIKTIFQLLAFFKTSLLYLCVTLSKMCPYSELFWSAVSRIQSECGENADQNNSECGHLSRSVNEVVMIKIFKSLLSLFQIVYFPTNKMLF